MNLKKSFVAFVLVSTLLVAPASMAAPGIDAGFGWLTGVQSFFADLFELFQFRTSTIERPYAGDSDTTQLQFGKTCEPGDGEMGTTPDPGGCP